MGYRGVDEWYLQTGRASCICYVPNRSDALGLSMVTVRYVASRDSIDMQSSGESDLALLSNITPGLHSSGIVVHIRLR